MFSDLSEFPRRLQPVEKAMKGHTSLKSSPGASIIAIVRAKKRV
jgi:hypothetical protein